MPSDIDLTPSQIVHELDKYIIGQERAKRLVALGLRNRIRRIRLPEDIRDEVSPKNIIMIGPTGVGKTEIARRLAKLTHAPFVKVEATKFTEVGYVGRDVESMVRDLMANAISMVKSEHRHGLRKNAKDKAEKRLLEILVPSKSEDVTHAKESIQQMLQNGTLEDKEIEMEISKKQNPTIEIVQGSQMEGMAFNMENMPSIFPSKKTTRRTTVKKAREYLLHEEIENLIDNEKVNEIAKERVEQYGIIFLDEIDKIISQGGNAHQNISREGVQRDILPIVEGSIVHTRQGAIDTTHILFIAAGAFHAVKPSDLIPELQGRFPLRVELQDLSKEDFIAILTTPKNALIVQYQELLKTEHVVVTFSADAINCIAEYAVRINTQTDNIGARRLHTLMELILEDVSFTADQIAGQEIPITRKYVESRLEEYTTDSDLSKYIL